MHYVPKFIDKATEKDLYKIAEIWRLYVAPSHEEEYLVLYDTLILYSTCLTKKAKRQQRENELEAMI